MQIMKEPGFKISEDGTIFVRMGRQSNCGGITQIQVCIEPTNNYGIEFAPSESESNNTDFACGILTGRDTPISLRSAVFEGAKEAYINAAVSGGIKLTLMYAFVEMVSSSEFMFRLVGEIAVRYWYESQSD